MAKYVNISVTWATATEMLKHYEALRHTLPDVKENKKEAQMYDEIIHAIEEELFAPRGP